MATGNEAVESVIEKDAELITNANNMEEVRIVEYDDTRHHEGFRKINEQWISELFVIEPLDIYEISHPVENIIDKGGYIFIAEYGKEVVGSFGMMRSKNLKYDFEMVKFAVNPKMRGFGIGKKLMERCLAKAYETGAKTLFLEGNTRCKSANHLYAKYGFEEVPIENAEFDRCDLQMVKKL